MVTSLKMFWQEEDGQDLVEYSLLMAFLALAAVTILNSTSTSIKSLFTTMSNNLSTAAASAAS